MTSNTPLRPVAFWSRFLKTLATIVALTSVWMAADSVRATIVGPYTPDAHTLHLWHMDETEAPVLDLGSEPVDLLNLANDATLGNASYDGFGTALSTFDGGPTANTAADKNAVLSPLPLVNGPGDNVLIVLADPDTGAFTMEALVRVDFDPLANYASGGVGRTGQMMLITGEDESNAGRIFQFRFNPIGTTGGNTVPQIEFIKVNQAAAGQVQNFPVDLPISGPDAIAEGNWYHVAVTYNGAEATADNLRFYWTLMDPSRPVANLIGTREMNADLVAGAPTDFAIGNWGRNPSTLNWVGLIDEVRISSIARGAGEMMFSTVDVVILEDPADQTAAIGQSVSFSVVAAGQPTLTYQWRHNTTPITGATESTFTIDASALTDAGSYDVVVSNDVSSETSAAALLTVRPPLNLVWLGSASFDWDTVALNWRDTATSATVAYSPGDHVRFDNEGVAGFVNLVGPLTPSSVVVDSDLDYTFITFDGGGITGDSQLTKQGSAALILENNNPYDGSTELLAGTLQVGIGQGVGSIGTGPVVNENLIIFDRTGTVTVPGDISGAGDIVKRSAGELVLAGENTFSGDITAEAGIVTLVGSQAIGNSTNVVLIGQGGGLGTQLVLTDDAVIGSDVHLAMSSFEGNFRSSLVSGGGSNAWNGPISLSGNNTIFVSAQGPLFELNGPVSSPDFAHSFALRGGGVGIMRSSVTVPNGSLAKTDGGVWTVFSEGPGSDYRFVLVVGGRLLIGHDDALLTSAFLQMGNGALDLGGFNQTASGLANDPTGARLIANSSTESDSVLTIAGSESWTFDGTIADSVADGTRNVGLTVSGVHLTLTGNNTYSGDTTVSAGTLALSGDGAILNSANINLAAGTTLDASARSDATLTVGATQTLSGDGTVNVPGNLASEGTIELNINKSGAVLTSDKIQGISQLTYGGTLRLLPGGDALAAGDSFDLFDATSHSGEFAAFDPAVPGPGLSWAISGGTLQVVEAALEPVFTGVAIVGSDIVLTASGGTPGGTVHLMASPDAAAPLASWTIVETATFDAGGEVSITRAIAPEAPQLFFILHLP